MDVEVIWEGVQQFSGFRHVPEKDDNLFPTVLMAGPLTDQSSLSEAQLNHQAQSFRPMELLLLGIGGCASYDVVQILEKSRQPIAGCRVKVTAKRADAIPAVFTHIHLHFLIESVHPSGDTSQVSMINQDKVARAISLSAEKYCSASIMFASAGVKMTHSFEIIGD